MSPSFYALFRRSKYSKASEADDTESAEKLQRRHLQTERFAVAAIAFCLKHDEQFRTHFLVKVCGETISNGAFDILIEEKAWGDLVLAAHDRSSVFVVECKIKAALAEHQDPTHPSNRFWQGGYGKEILDRYATYAKQIVYIVLGYAPKLNGLPYVRSNLSCVQKQWIDLKHELPQTTLCSDLASTLAVFHVNAFRSDNSNNMNKSTDALKASETFGLLNDVLEEVGFVGISPKADISFESNENWYFGLIIRTSQSATGPFKLLHDSVLPQNNQISWLGYTNGDTAGSSKPSVWFWCAPSQFTMLKARLTRSGVVASRITTDQDDGWDYLVVSAEADDITAKGGDKEWFKNIFTSVLQS